MFCWQDFKRTRVRNTHTHRNKQKNKMDDKNKGRKMEEEKTQWIIDGLWFSFLIQYWKYFFIRCISIVVFPFQLLPDVLVPVNNTPSFFSKQTKASNYNKKTLIHIQRQRNTYTKGINKNRKSETTSKRTARQKKYETNSTKMPLSLLLCWPYGLLAMWTTLMCGLYTQW